MISFAEKQLERNHKFNNIPQIFMLSCRTHDGRERSNVIQIQTHHILPQFYAAIDTI